MIAHNKVLAEIRKHNDSTLCDYRHTITNRIDSTYNQQEANQDGWVMDTYT